MVILRPDQAKINPRFLEFFLRSEAFAQQVKGLTSGSAQPQLPIRDLRQVAIPIPPIPEQHEIAGILGALDDKIEVNRRMAATLEEMARSLYRSWFVDFDPVHAKAAGHPPAHMDKATAALFPDRFGDDGLPEGWRAMCFDEVAKLKNGFAFKSADWTVDGIPVIKIGSVKPGLVDIHTGSFVDRATGQGKEAFRAAVGSALIGLTGYVGEVGRVPPCNEAPLVNQRVARVDPINGREFSPFVYTVARTPEFKEFVVSKSYGSAQANVSTKDISSFTFAGSRAIIEEFDKMLESAFDRQILLHGENQTLATLRNSLLPRLMSGDLRVAAARELVEDVA